MLIKLYWQGDSVCLPDHAGATHNPPHTSRLIPSLNPSLDADNCQVRLMPTNSCPCMLQSIVIITASLQTRPPLRYTQSLTQARLAPHHPHTYPDKQIIEHRYERYIGVLLGGYSVILYCSHSHSGDTYTFVSLASYTRSIQTFRTVYLDSCFELRLWMPVSSSLLQKKFTSPECELLWLTQSCYRSVRGVCHVYDQIQIQAVVTISSLSFALILLL